MYVVKKDSGDQEANAKGERGERCWSNVSELGEMLRSRAERMMPLASSLGVYTVTGEKAETLGR